MSKDFVMGLEKIHYYFKELAYAVIIVAGGLLIYIGVLLFWPFNETKIVEPIKITTHNIKVGDKLGYVVDYCNYTTRTLTINRRIVNIDTMEVVALPSRYLRLPPGCGKFDTEVKLPTEAVPGTYILQKQVYYHLNVVRTSNREYESERFNILP